MDKQGNVMTAEEWLNGNQLSIDIWKNKYCYNNESLESWFERVSNHNRDIIRLLKEKKFIFGGRTLSNINTNKKGSYSNCYSHGFIGDSLEDIMNAANNIAMTFKAQGGQGLSLSKIRPKGAMIKNQFKSDGIVPFMEIFNTVTESISQGGSRKGALLMSLDVWHPEIKSFITIKSDLKRINKANLSVEIDDEFMQAVIDDKENIELTWKYGDNKEYEFPYTINPTEIFNILCTNACRYAEPGVIFVNRFRNYNIMQYISDYVIETCNPCGEQPLPKHGACNLSSINLSEYVINPYTPNAKIAYDWLHNDIPYIVRAMDDVLEMNLNNHALKEQREMAYNYRNIGIGITGLADMLIKLGVKYGSPNAVGIAETIMKFIFRESLLSSVALADERGSFPKYNSKVWNADIIKNAFNREELEELKNHNKLRNCSLLSIAPAGSIGTMLNVATGCEPFFMLSYKRKTESLNGKDSYYDVEVPVVQEYKKLYKTDILPDYFITSREIPWKDRVKMQGALQKFCDTAISSTVNLPKETTSEDIKALYIEAWKQGLKGITVYVDGSRDPILSDKNDIVTTNITTSKAPKRPKDLPADLHLVKVKGEQFIVLVGLYNDKPYEIFTFRPNIKLGIENHRGVITKKSKMHYMFKSDLIQITELELANENLEEKAATLYASMLLRHGVDIKYIIKTAKKVNDNISSFTSAMCRILSKYMPNESLTDKCPECGGELIRESGCVHCKNCGWSKCS